MLRNKETEAQVLSRLREWSASSARSKQERIGWSEIGGCARSLAYRLIAQPVTNHDTQVLASIRGTAVHDVLERAFTGFGVLTEAEVEYRGVIGHLDRYDRSTATVRDWKTKDRDGMASVRSYGPDRSHIWALHGYAAGLVAAGEQVDKVELVYVGVSPTDDVYAIEMPYEQGIADAAIDHLEDVQHGLGSGQMPEPERDASSFCAKFCRFYDASGAVGCTGRTNLAATYAASDPWDDGQPNAAAAADYAKGGALVKDGKALQVAAKEKLIGSRGVAGGYVVSWTAPQAREVPDADAAVSLCRDAGIAVPMTVKQASPAIRVTPVTAAGLPKAAPVEAAPVEAAPVEAAPFPDLLAIGAEARARGGYGADEIVPGVTRAEAIAAALHATVAQGGFSTPEIEAERIASDRSRDAGV